jgi:serine/threonine protein kinase
MAEVFKAKSYNDAGFEKVVALKRLLPAAAEKPGFVEMLIQEAQIASGLVHPNICPIYELGKVGDAYYLTMEFIYGHDLRQCLQALKMRDEMMDPWLGAWLALQASAALDYAWAEAKRDGEVLQLVHRDVSPQNVMIGFDGRVKVIDFGIAKFSKSTVQTAAGVLKGKYAYMSPEHAHRCELDARADVWSLGIVMHELLSARRLFVGSSMADTIDQVLHREIPRLDHVPEALADIIDKMLQRDLSKRYADHGEAHAALATFLAGAPGPITGHDVVKWMDTLFPHDKRIESDLTEQEVRLIFSAEERGEETTDMRTDVSQATQIFLMDETGQADYREVLQALIESGRVHTEHTSVQDDPRLAGAANSDRPSAPPRWWDVAWTAVCGVTAILLLTIF